MKISFYNIGHIWYRKESSLCCLTWGRRSCLWNSCSWKLSLGHLLSWETSSGHPLLPKLDLLSMDTPLNSRQQLFAYRHTVAIVTGMYSDITRQVLGFLHGQLIPSTTRPSAFPYFRHLFLSKNKAFGVVAQENTNWKQAASCTGSNFSHIQKKRLK